MISSEAIQYEDGYVRLENGEDKGIAGDGQFLKRGTSVNI
jgi:hypothetical protein